MFPGKAYEKKEIFCFEHEIIEIPSIDFALNVSTEVDGYPAYSLYEVFFFAY